MEEQEAVPVNLCKNFKSVFVTGRREKLNIKQIRPAHDLLCSLLHNLPVADVEDKFPMKIVWNSAKEDKKMPAIEVNDVKEIQRYVQEMAECSCGCTLVIITHGLGSSVVHEALTEDGWKKYFGEDKTEKSSCAISNIRERMQEHLVIITLGGTCNIPEDMAKLAVNIVWDNDHVAKLTQYFYGEDEKIGKKCFRAIFSKKDEKVEMNPIKSESKSYFFSALAAAISASSSCNHALEKYVQKDIRAYLIKCLSLKYPSSCKCS